MDQRELPKRHALRVDHCLQQKWYIWKYSHCCISTIRTYILINRSNKKDISFEPTTS